MGEYKRINVTRRVDKQIGIKSEPYIIKKHTSLTLDSHGVNYHLKRHRLKYSINKQDPNVCCLQETQPDMQRCSQNKTERIERYSM